MSTLEGLLTIAAEDPRIAGLMSHVGEPTLHITGIDAARPWVIGALARKVPVLVATATGREAEDLAAELRALLGRRVALFPAWETLPHERLSPSSDIVGQRARVLSGLAARGRTDLSPEDPVSVVIASARALSQPFLRDVEGRGPLILREGEEHDLSVLRKELVFRAYEHVDMVARRGQFAVRGGILDVFPTTTDYPVRVEMWGDEIDEIRSFSVADQRAVEDGGVGRLAIYPARELPITDDVAARAKELAARHTGNPTLVELLTKVSEKQPADGMEGLLPALSGSPMVTLLDVMPEDTHAVMVSPEKIAIRIADLVTTDDEFLAAGWEAAAMGASGPVAAEGLDVSAASYRTLEELRAAAERAGRSWWTFSPPGMLVGAESDTLPLEFEPAPAPRGKPDQIDAMMDELRALTNSGGRAAFVTPTRAAVKRMVERFAEKGIRASVADHPALGAAGDATGKNGSNGERSRPLLDPDDCVPVIPQPAEVTIYQALSHSGIRFRGCVVVTETDLTGNRVGDIARAKRRPARRRNRVDPLALSAGDFVVHETHGIGRFLKMAERTISMGGETSRREYIVLEYASSRRGQPADQLWVPMESLDLLSKYSGGEEPRLSKMGGSDWKNTKKKARAAVREIAAELVELYAKRQAAPGHAFAPDTPWQRELEEDFPYQETEDQLTAIDAVKADMESTVPMDRVVVGDVGYGKTEVAVRAAFKAVQDGTQVAVLVPTTLLAQQHFNTFSERMEGFGVTIKELSRFTPTGEAKRIIAGLADGSVDVVIGTHRLLQTGVHWKTLGLIIIDEEQRFGVEHKEHIKALRSNVDVLTLSATPIPRTLEMSMSGIREMSTILTPPEERHPVLTYVGPQEDAQIAAAIRRELLREGQVFVIHNKVRSIDARARELRDLVPEARIVVAHGQMSEEMLERTVQGFWDREYDVLVCTTIVETGLDIANANTLIVENAHHMGLSQLHQLRGRVGRSRQRGYAYFVYPKGTALTETSYDRLSTIAQNNDLGAGMAVAMKDLEMRGAGNVLGSQQSGHIAGVGFDLYIRLVGEAVAAYRNLASGKPLDATDSGPKEIRIDLPVDAHIPERYINSERLRLEVYRKLAAATTETDLRLAIEEMEDRFGPVPEEVTRLLAVARLRRAARAAGLTDIVVQGTRIKVHPLVLPDSKQVRLRRRYPGASYRAAAQAVQLAFPKAGKGMGAPKLRDEDLLQWLADFLAEMCGVESVDVRGPGAHKKASDDRRRRMISVSE